MNDTIIVILKKMFEIIGEKYSYEKTMGDDWYLSHTWTEKQELYFIDWLTDYLYNNKSARQYIMSFPKKNIKECHKAAHQFTCWYGWKTEKDEFTRDKKTNTES